jgi:hypothetical protein
MERRNVVIKLVKGGEEKYVGDERGDVLVDSRDDAYVFPPGSRYLVITAKMATNGQLFREGVDSFTVEAV